MDAGWSARIINYFDRSKSRFSRIGQLNSKTVWMRDHHSGNRSSMKRVEVQLINTLLYSVLSTCSGWIG